MANNGPHAAGIFADMTVDGPEIGTLVLVVDRAKNLPNRKTMGKQNPYAAARLGKEARKTETDKRGGQTPRWDQELRFTVHDSPDYYTLKISVFSEDKRTDLIGEAWVRLDDVVVPGGGKNDLWQGLNCKGKYAGEIRIELTYYDTREKPEKESKVMSVADELKAQYGSISKVKRRPLPVNPNQPNANPVMVPEKPAPGRAKHGPRDFATPPRANSMPPEGPKTFNYPHSQATLFGQKPVSGYASTGHSPAPVGQVPEEPYYGEYDPSLGPQAYDPEPGSSQPDFLPQLRPSSRQRGSMPPQPRYAQQQPPTQQHLRPQSHIGLPHSHSAPAVPTHPEQHGYDDQQLHTDYPEPIPDVDYQYQQVQRRNDVPHGWEVEYGSPGDRQPYMEEELESPPPPPPIHSHSSPAVPHYASPHSRPYPPAAVARHGTTPPRQQFVPSSSPLQSIERNYATPPSHGRPARGHSFDGYGESPYQAGYASTPNLTPPNQQSPPLQGGPTSHGRQYPARHSVAELYSTPSRPHPLSQEVPRARSPNPYARELPGTSPHQYDYRTRDAVPLIKPRALSPQPAQQAPPPVQASARPKSSYSIQHPVRAFESSDDSPLSTSQPSSVSRPVPRAAPVRKSVSPRPSMSDGSRIPFSPDSFGVHNPNAPHGDEDSPTRKGPIVGWHGQEIDPSDHLPVHSWAPEPEQKMPNKQYGLGRDRDFGPRTQGILNTAGRVSRDTMINVRMKEPEPVPEPQPSKIRARLVKKSGGGSSPNPGLRDHANFNSIPNPYDQQQQYGRGYHEEDMYGPPSLPPKVPLDYGPDALEREIAGIDIGSSRRPAPASYVPVRSHRDRNSFY
ncbi:hypothetical protein PRZ48_004821 [Zasmidium cellare]|uniref:C2 domain-containing protein n=1 Tax=Zasmidium cellare TaxID=395010 RepID=A0ABR0ERN4_ZASCE|nr:hypothetical protein PRZ48_004821 [Zasmidium cellare]